MQTVTPTITVPTAVRIQRGGDSLYPTVTLAHDGSPIPAVRSVTIGMYMDRVPSATIETITPEVDVVAEADILTTTLPNGRRYRLVPLDGEPAATRPHPCEMTVEQFVANGIGSHPNYAVMREGLVADILAIIDTRTRQRDEEWTQTVLRCTSGVLHLNHPLPPEAPIPAGVFHEAGTPKTIDPTRSELSVLNVMPGDRLVVTLPDPPSAALEARIREGLERFAPGVPTLVLTNGATLGVLRAETQ